MEIIKFHYILFLANKECKQHLEYTQNNRLDSTFNVHNSNQLIYTLLICLLNNETQQIENKQTVYCI